MRCYTALTFTAVLTACSHPLEIVGEGDILSLTGTRDCLLEQAQASSLNCTQNLVLGDYQESYFAQPRPGWTFDRWENYCVDAPDNTCAFNVSANGVQQAWGQAVLPLRAVFREVNPSSRNYEMHLYRNTFVNDGVADFFTDYTYHATCHIQIASQGGPIPPNTFVSVMSADFEKFECVIPGNDNTYEFTFGSSVPIDDYWRAIDTFPETDVGLLFDASGLPLRFDSPQVSFSSNSYGWFDSPEEGNFGITEHSYWVPELDDDYQTPLAVLLEPTQILGILRPRGRVVNPDFLPPGANAAPLNGEFGFDEQNRRDGTGAVIDNPLTISDGYYTFTEIE